MQSRLFFKQNGEVVRCSHRHDGLWVAGAAALLLSLLAWGYSTDHEALADDGFAAGKVAGRAEMAEVVGEAYRQGAADALGLRLADVPQLPPAVLCQAPMPADRSLRRSALRDALCGEVQP